MKNVIVDHEDWALSTEALASIKARAALSASPCLEGESRVMTPQTVVVVFDRV